MLPIFRFRVKGVSLECMVLNPTNTPLREHGCQRGSFFTACSTGSNTYTGHPNKYIYLILCLGMVDPVNKSDGAIPLSLVKWL